jgi:hypothetical protein
MSSAWYTNRKRVLAEAALTKVQYPGRVAVNNVILSVQNCQPNFSVLDYIPPVNCRKYKSCNPVVPEPTLGSILDGGNYTTESTTVLDGGNYTTESTTILDGGNS